uniref:Putative secreted protein n=1 Tax=Panstrongylus lignarius TaxID=156445 RepID=A0A224XTV3_9HEMI
MFFIIFVVIPSIPGDLLFFNFLIVFLDTLGDVKIQSSCFKLGMKNFLVTESALRVKEGMPRLEFIVCTFSKSG